MADAEGRIGTGGTFVRKHAVERNSKLTLLRQDPAAANLVTMMGAR
jgi:hypothetical protein